QVGSIWLAGPLAGIIGQLGVGKISDSTWFMGSRRRPYIIAGSIMAALMLWFLPNLQFFGGGSLLITALIVALTLDLAIN
ncbi:MAG TPA: MFS transporter, partial [Chitinophagales bacterium]|nr:MFS transporter [Chitinophagales bacterium]